MMLNVAELVARVSPVERGNVLGAGEIFGRVEEAVGTQRGKVAAKHHGGVGHEW